jgi:hypothetical protein
LDRLSRRVLGGGLLEHLRVKLTFDEFLDAALARVAIGCGLTYDDLIYDYARRRVTGWVFFTRVAREKADRVCGCVPDDIQ